MGVKCRKSGKPKGYRWPKTEEELLARKEKNRIIQREANRRWRQTPSGKASRCRGAAAFRKKNPESVAKTKRKCRWQDRYGITESDYEAMFERQGGKCAVCGATEYGGPRRATRFAADHDHVTKKIRGLVCFRCNSVIGMLGDNFAGVSSWTTAALAYLSE